MNNQQKEMISWIRDCLSGDCQDPECAFKEVELTSKVGAWMAHLAECLTEVLEEDKGE